MRRVKKKLQQHSGHRVAGLLSERGISVDDRGDVSGFRWRVDKANPRAMNVSTVATVAKASAERVAAALATDAAVLVLGGDCTVELGTVAGAPRGTQSVGVVNIDLDTDLNTPESTKDGALDWMGVAHMLGVKGAVPELAGLGPRVPMLRAEQVSSSPTTTWNRSSGRSSKTLASPRFGWQTLLRIPRVPQRRWWVAGRSSLSDCSYIWMSTFLTTLICRSRRTTAATLACGSISSWCRFGLCCTRQLGRRSQSVSSTLTMAKAMALRCGPLLRPWLVLLHCHPMAKRLMHPMRPNNGMQGTPINVAPLLLALCRAPDAGH